MVFRTAGEELDEGSGGGLEESYGGAGEELVGAGAVAKELAEDCSPS